MEGKGSFKIEDWDAPIYIGAEELRHALAHMQLENKVIQGYRLLDYSDVQLPEWIDPDDEIMIPIFAALSSPLIILFTDGTAVTAEVSPKVLRLQMKRCRQFLKGVLAAEKAA